MTTNTNRYPFATKAQILASQASDDVVKEHLVTLYSLQTGHEQATKTTVTRNHQGFMSSHAVWGCKLAEKIAAGEDLSQEELDRARGIVKSYSKQLAAAARDAAVEANPELATSASCFFSKQS